MSGNEDISERLYEPDRKQRQDLWKFIKLVAPTNEKKRWRTKDATGAFCEKCNKEINYSSGTSQQILRHMEKHHPDDIGMGGKSFSGNKCPSLKQQSIHQATKN